MSTTSKWEGEGPIAGLASKLRTKEDVGRIMCELVKGLAQGREMSLKQVVSVQDFYARRFYDHTNFSEVKEALAKYMLYKNYLK